MQRTRLTVRCTVEYRMCIVLLTRHPDCKGRTGARCGIPSGKGCTMVFAGCDIGIVSAKAVLVSDRKLISSHVLPYKTLPGQAATMVMDAALSSAGLSEEDIQHCLATGLGAEAVSLASGIAPDLVCLSRGCLKVNPRVRTIIDVGGNSFTTFTIDETGRLIELAITDNCLGGTGMFLETMAGLLEIPLADLISRSMQSTNPLPITNQCVVFAESEAISLINTGHDPYDIFAGIGRFVAARIAGMAGRIGLREELALVGGVADNALVTQDLRSHFALDLADLDGVDPQIVCAYGAALLAQEAASK